MQNPKKFVAIGQVDSGKSTMCGHLLYICGYIDERTMEKIRLKAREDKMESWIWARVLDVYEEEQERGKTHEFDSVTFENKTTGKSYQLIDTPGHQKFIRSMIEGISGGVNIAIIMISMKDNEFEAAFGNGMMREHLILARAIGIEHLILIANKMDFIDWDEKKCKAKIGAVTRYLVKSLCWPKDKLHVVPISAFTGVGLMDTVGIPDWYKGKSFIDTLDSIDDKKIETVDETVDECNRFVCDVTNLSEVMNISTNENNEDNGDEKTNQRVIISAGSILVMHYNGEEIETKVEKISNKGKPFIKSGEEGKCIFLTSQRIILQLGLRVIFRKANNTIGFGTVTKIF